jgi:hypothetical protein
MRHNSLTDGQADARAWDFAPMQTFEYPEDASMVLSRDANTIVAHHKDAFGPSRLGGNVNARGFLAVVLESVRGQILENLHEMRAGYSNSRQLRVRDLRMARVNPSLQMFNDLSHDRAGVAFGINRALLLYDPSVRKKILDEFMNAPRPFHSAAQKVVRLRIKFADVIPLQELSVKRNIAYGFLQIVRRGVRELTEAFSRPLE